MHLVSEVFGRCLEEGPIAAFQGEFVVMDDRAAHAGLQEAENGRQLGSRFTKIFNVPQRYSWGLVSSTDSLEAHCEHLAHLPFTIIDSKIPVIDGGPTSITARQILSVRGTKGSGTTVPVSLWDD